MINSGIDVFVSYASADRERVAPLVSALENQGWQVWWDRKIEAGEAFDREIEAALAEARCVVVVWTDASVESDWVRAEAGEGLDRGVLIPVLLDGVRPPLAFRRTQAVPSAEPSVLARAVATTLSEEPRLVPERRPRRFGAWYAYAGMLLAAAVAIAVYFLPGSPEVPPPIEELPMGTLAVMPFVVRGDQEFAYLGDAMVDLLVARLDALPGFHGIDSFTLVKAASRTPDSSSDPQTAAALASRLGAGRFVLGSVVQGTDAVEIMATLFGSDGRQLTRASVEVLSTDELLVGVDELARLLIAEELSAPFESYASLGALTTQSMEALRRYLEGERAYRAGQYHAATFRFLEATQMDPQFALAWFRVVIASGLSDPELGFAAQQKVRGLRDKLPLPQRELQRAYEFGDDGKLKAAWDVLAKLVTAYPDDIEAIRFLAEITWRHNQYFGRDARDASQLLQRILAIDPNDTWARLLLMEVATMNRDSAAIETHLAVLREGTAVESAAVSPNNFQIFASYLGGTVQAPETAQLLVDEGPQAAFAALTYFAPRMRDPQLVAELHERLGGVQVDPAMSTVIAASQDLWEGVDPARFKHTRALAYACYFGLTARRRAQQAASRRSGLAASVGSRG